MPLSIGTAKEPFAPTVNVAQLCTSISVVFRTYAVFGMVRVCLVPLVPSFDKTLRISAPDTPFMMVMVLVSLKTTETGLVV